MTNIHGIQKQHFLPTAAFCTLTFYHSLFIHIKKTDNLALISFLHTNQFYLFVITAKNILEHYKLRIHYLSEHFFLCTMHFLVSFIGGQGVPRADGFCSISRVLVSLPRLKPHVFPLFVHWLQGLHSLTAQCAVGAKQNHESNQYFYFIQLQVSIFTRLLILKSH